MEEREYKGISNKLTLRFGYNELNQRIELGLLSDIAKVTSETCEIAVETEACRQLQNKSFTQQKLGNYNCIFWSKERRNSIYLAPPPQTKSF